MTNNPIKGKKIAFVIYDYSLLLSTMVLNSVYLLAQNNEVLVITNDKNLTPSSCEEWLFNIIKNPPSYLSTHIIFVIFRKFCSFLSLIIPSRFAFLKWYMRSMELNFFSFWLNRLFVSNQFDIVIPVECLSLISVKRASRGQEDLIYFNMELLDWEEGDSFNNSKTTVKNLEFEAIKAINYVMITSPDRASIFSEINQYPRNRISILPIMPLKHELNIRTRYFHEKFNIPDNYSIVVYSGAFMPWAMCLEIIESMDSWPQKVVLVMHTGLVPDNSYFKKMQEAAENHPVFFSTDFILYKDLAPALSSADIGLLFYEAIDANFSEILFSSNKMAEYISAGLPVICSPLPSLQAFVNEHGIGKSTDFSEIGSSISQIVSDIEKYRECVIQCQKFFIFEPYFNKAFSDYLETKSYLPKNEVN